MNKIAIIKVMYNKPATIVFWSDGSKTVSRCGENEVFDKEKGLMAAILKRFLGGAEPLNIILESFARTPVSDECETIENPIIEALEKKEVEIENAINEHRNLTKKLFKSAAFAKSMNPEYNNRCSRCSVDAEKVEKAKCCHMQTEGPVAMNGDIENTGVTPDQTSCNDDSCSKEKYPDENSRKDYNPAEILAENKGTSDNGDE